MKKTSPAITRQPAAFQAAFKEADIRGVYPHELNDETVYFIARAFVERSQYKKVVVGRDMRLSSPALRAAFVSGVCDAGADVVDIGLVTTPMLYFASVTLDLPGVMITASHSPADHNGLKLVAPRAVPLTERAGLGDIRRRLARGRFLPDASPQGRVIKKDIMPAFARFMRPQLKLVKGKTTPPRVVVDCGSGMGTMLLPLLTAAGYQVTPLFAELDGRFPQRGSNPTIPKNQKAISAELRSGEYDFGIAFDGDADRIAFFDERGRYVNCATIGALMAERLLPDHPKAVCVGTVLTSRAYEAAVKDHGGRFVRARVGHSYVKEVMRARDALIGCEHSGHFFFKDFFGVDSVLVTLGVVTAAYQTAGVAFSALLSPYTTFHQTDDVMVPVTDKAHAMATMHDFLRSQGSATITTFDGLTADYGEAWVVVKPSVTEAALNIIAEGKTKAAATTLRDRVLAQARTLG
jgi:phosphomannomutase